jgi:hypothetical protein
MSKVGASEGDKSLRCGHQQRVQRSELQCLVVRVQRDPCGATVRISALDRLGKRIINRRGPHGKRLLLPSEAMERMHRPVHQSWELYVTSVGDSDCHACMYVMFSGLGAQCTDK